jgi:hypothetical protein
MTMSLKLSMYKSLFVFTSIISPASGPIAEFEDKNYRDDLRRHNEGQPRRKLFMPCFMAEREYTQKHTQAPAQPGDDKKSSLADAAF